MSIFVSYAKSDVDGDELRRLAKLEMIERVVRDRLGPAFIDEIQNRYGTHAAVEAALASATAFCIVRGSSYLERDSTKWEFGQAARRGLPMYEISLPDLELRPLSPLPASSR